MSTKICFLLFFLLGIAMVDLPAQEFELSLESVIQSAQGQSIAARRAHTLQVTQYWEWRSFKANYRPQVTLAGRVPGLSRIFEEVRQPDGSIEFRSIFQSNMYGGISLSQPISATGGTVFLGTNLQRFDNLNEGVQNKRLYNASPLQVGFEQPFFQFNPLRWDKQIEPLRYQESQQAYIGNIASIAVQAVDLFFALLLAQTDLAIAQTNVANTDTIFQITEEKYEMGKISRNDLLQLRLEKLKAAKALASAEPEVQIAALNLRSYVGYVEVEKWKILLPAQIPALEIAAATALREAHANRPDAIGFERKALEAKQELARAKGSTGFSARLYGTLGFTNSAENLSEVYQAPIGQQAISLEFSLPILDWGRAKSQIETARANQQLAMDDIEQSQRDFEQIILTELSLFRQYYQQVSLNQEVDELSEIRYQIAQDRFLTGNLNITDLILALQEKGRAKRDYIRSLWEYWRSYHRIRELTLYDFEANQKLEYSSKTRRQP